MRIFPNVTLHKAVAIASAPILVSSGLQWGLVLWMVALTIIVLSSLEVLIERGGGEDRVERRGFRLPPTARVVFYNPETRSFKNPELCSDDEERNLISVAYFGINDQEFEFPVDKEIDELTGLNK